MESNKVKLIFEKQLLHWVLLASLLIMLSAASRLDGFWSGQALGINTRVWFLLALVNTIVHQFYVWFCWRAELHGGLLTRVFGRAAFKVYAAGFSALILLRPILITFLAVSNSYTFSVHTMVMRTAGVISLLPAAYLGYSIVNYFGFTRAFGIDHFDPFYRSLPLVREGIFKLTPNAMYLFGFFLLWAPALFFSSLAALAIALFSHLYIWVHYFTVEEPDMERIYGR